MFVNDSVSKLKLLGWSPFFQQQLSLEEFDSLIAGRLIEQHRSKLIVASARGDYSVNMPSQFEQICVGDWVLFDETNKVIRLLERKSLFQRKTPGSGVSTQLIAANIDKLMIVCSLNNDFNLSRIERYLAIAKEACVEPILILTKADQCEDVEAKIEQIQRIDINITYHSLNALEQSEIKQLEQHCSLGSTIAFMGSSGVGKSTLINGLLGHQALKTSAIRENDSKGRHTTTFRTLKVLPQGGILMDTPGMRELQLVDCEQGISETFSEITALAKQCAYRNCSHSSEPNCAIQRAIEEGSVSTRRFNSFQKLLKEQAFNSATLYEKKAKEKAFCKMVNRVQKATKNHKKGEN